MTAVGAMRIDFGGQNQDPVLVEPETIEIPTGQLHLEL
jgi:hypothetical protein